MFPMHPALIVVPLLGAVFGPRLWAGRQLARHDVHDDAYLPAGELARRLLDREGLTLVRVEVTDVGDHYDPVAKAVRLNRDHFDRRSLTAATAAAHEVGHALQDASGYWAFRLHHSLARVARVTTGVGTALLLAVPAAAIAARTPTPPRVLSLSAAAMLGTGLGAQLVALPSELDASFDRALPLLRDCCLSEEQARDARRILLACSLTYLASAAVPALVLAPWMARVPAAGLLPDAQRRRLRLRAAQQHGAALPAPAQGGLGPVRDDAGQPPAALWRAAPRPSEPRASCRREFSLLRTLARPVVRAGLRVWLRSRRNT
jgi:Zn-dependent membrane protease YugP